MEKPKEYVLLRAYLLKADRPPHVPTFQRIVQAARDAKLLGATVMQGILGTGHGGEARPSFWSFAERVPVVVEILDTADRIADFIRDPLDSLMIGGMLTLERAVILRLPKSSESTTTTQPNVDAKLQLATKVQPLSTVPKIGDLIVGSHMTVQENGVMVRVFIGESDRLGDKPLYEAIVQKVRELGLAGATVLRGTEGFGAHSVVHQASLLVMSTDLPVIVEIVDAEAKITALLPHLQTMVQGGMITMEYVAIALYHHGKEPLTHQMPDHPDAMK